MTSAETPLTGRFAPSPTGRMHAGNIYAALVAWIVAKRSGGDVALRIEDLDPERSKPEFTDALMRDFEFLGLFWDRGPFYQSTRTDAYAEVFHMLEGRGLTYPCFCTRADLHAASAPHRGEKPVYPGTCRNLTAEQREQRTRELAAEGRAPSMRLIAPDETFSLKDLFQGPYRQNLQHDCGDFLIRRSDGAFAYQLAVVLDDKEQGVTSVVRGVDLLCSTPQQIYLQKLLGAPTPEYGHIPLLVQARSQSTQASHTGQRSQPAAGRPTSDSSPKAHQTADSVQTARRLSKRDNDAGIEVLRKTYGSPEAILGHIAHVAGLIDQDEPASASDLLKCANLDALRNKIQIPWS